MSSITENRQHNSVPTILGRPLEFAQTDIATFKMNNIKKSFIAVPDGRNLLSDLQETEVDTEIDTEVDTEIDTEIDTEVDTETDNIADSPVRAPVVCASPRLTKEQVVIILDQPIPLLPKNKKGLLGYEELNKKFSTLVKMFNKKRARLQETPEWLEKVTKSPRERRSLYRDINGLFGCLRSWREDFRLIHILVDALDKIPHKDLIRVATKTTGKRAGQLVFGRQEVKTLVEILQKKKAVQLTVEPSGELPRKDSKISSPLKRKKHQEAEDDTKSRRRKIMRLEQDRHERHEDMTTEEYISLQQHVDDDKEKLLIKSKRKNPDISASASVMDDPKCYPWTNPDKDYTYITNVSDILQQEILDFVNYISPTSPEHRMRSFVVNSIRKIVKKEWSTAKVLAFGSYYSNLYLPTSDIDVVVLGAPSKLNLRKMLNKLAKALKDSGVADASNCIVLYKSKVPIIKMTENLTSYKVDISFGTTNGLKGAKYTENVLKREKALRPLTLILKQYLSLKSQNEVYNGGIGSFSLMCMIFSFLQMHPKIQSGEILAEQNMGTLLVEFLEFYGKSFNAKKVGIRVTNGGSYYNKVDVNRLNPSQGHLISIEDPQDPTNDLGAKSFRYDRVRISFATAFELLQERLLAYNNARYEIHRNLDLTASKILQHGNILANGLLTSILEVPQSIVKHRERITNIFYRGNFANMKENELEDEWDEVFEHFTFSGSDLEESADIILPQLLNTKEVVEEKKTIYSKEEKEEIRQRNESRRIFWEKKGGEEWEQKIED